MPSRLTCRSCSLAAAIRQVKVKARVGDIVKLCKESAQLCVFGPVLLHFAIRCAAVFCLASCGQETAQRLQLPCRCQSLAWPVCWARTKLKP